MKHGRKFALAVGFMILAFVVVLLSFYLALAQKLTSEWASVTNMFLGAGSLVIGAFSGANAVVEWQAIKHGADEGSEG